ncbi:ATPase arsa1 [Trebouxia sp. C0010 RCD-2024]
MQTSHRVLQQPSGICAEAKRCMHRPGLPAWCTRTQPGLLARQRPQDRLGQTQKSVYARGPVSGARTAFPSLQDRRQTSCTVSTGFKHQVRCAAAAEQVEAVQHVPADSSFEAMAAGTKRKYIMISGKGGVGKTSLAASLAVKFAAAGHTTLVVSTDPAHSLSDSLDQDISGGQPVQLEGTDLPVWGMEIDPDKAKQQFRSYSATDKGSKGVQDVLGGLGLGAIAGQLADLQLGELLDTPPPGLDEAVAIAKVVEFVRSDDYARFTRIIFDTAPTGHTLRLLSVPDFVEASLGKIIRLRKKLAGAGDAVRSLFRQSAQQDEAVAKLEALRDSVVMVKELFRDKDLTEFIIATIPTVLGINESRRLLQALRKEQIPCRRIIINQVIGPNQGDAYLKMKLKDQNKAMQILQESPSLQGLTQIQAPYVDLEVRGLPALQYFGNLVWQDAFKDQSGRKGQQYYMLGGKGGVGKTSSAASLGVRLGSDGGPTLVVSTDPAHSLSDSLDQDVSGGKPVRVGDSNLWGMEIDVAAAAEEIRNIGKADKGKGVEDVLGSFGLGAFADQLKDLRLSELLDTLPPGIDEAVAISKVVQFLKSPEYSHFQHIVFDTAPTGHTLRLLTLPDFLDKTIGKVVRLRQKLSDITGAVSGMFGRKAEKDPAVARLDALKARMEEAKALFRNSDTTQFIIVTIPTVMAAAESARLADALRKEGVPVNLMVINQVIQAAATGKFLEARRRDQQRAMATLRSDETLGQLEVVEGPLVDLEVRGVPALQYFGNKVWQ